jgi:pyridoxine 4-dehydrogenase
MTSLPTHDLPGGTARLGDLEVTRVGYGAMQLAGPGVFGPPKDRDEAVRVLRAVVDLGINHIDTSDFYGPHVTNEIIHEALAPYPENLVLVTKVGARRDDKGNWLPALEPDELRSAVHDNLRRLGVESLGAVNLRLEADHDNHMGPMAQPVAERYGVLAELQQQGLIRELGISTASADQIAEAQTVAPVACVQNAYNLAHREDDALVDSLAAQDIAYVPYFPLGGFSPLQSQTLDDVAERLGTGRLAVALAWLLQRSPNILLIPGTSSVEHLKENVTGAGLELPADALAELDTIGR